MKYLAESRGLRSGLGMILACMVLLVVAACGSSAKLTASSAPGEPDATVTAPLSSTDASTTAVTRTATGPTVSTPAATRAAIRTGSDANVAATSSSQGFLGIATELGTINRLAGSPNNLDAPFVQLLKNLSLGAPLLLRLGGDSSDEDWWALPGVKAPLAIRYTLTPQWGASVKALLTAANAKALLGVNLELDSKRVAADEVKQYDKYVGSSHIDGFELGNEPELYAAFNYYHRANGTGVLGRPFGHYTLLDYAKDFSNIATALKGYPLIGPSSGSATWLPDLGEMLSALPSRLKLVTVHAYPLKHCSAAADNTVSDFFTPASIQGLAGSIHAMVLAARAHGKPLRLDEINGITCGGQGGVSNSFAEALWALNVLPALWQAGVQGVNFQDIDGNWNQMITATDTSSGWSVGVEPEYYGLVAFADAAPAGSHLLKLTQPGYPDLYEFAVKDPNGERRVVLTNVSSAARTVGVSVAGGRGTGVISALSAASLTATSGATLAGQSLSPTSGQLAGAASYTLVRANSRGVYAVRVPAHSAAILTVGS
jgi:hypothetical protein